ncbi:MAG: inorganic diphosphatase [Coxiellaceae bacterium]|nr:inorganic diphosphatase [Coxiellaceae bacterium]
MGIDSISPGSDLANDINAIIEIPAHSPAVKYELDKDSGMLMVDRFMATSMHYPCDYGFVPNTLSADGDPVDIMVVSPMPLQAGCLMRCRAIGMLRMTDESGEDNKVLALPIKKICAHYAHLDTMEDLSPILLESIEHFFENYKKLEPGKWVKLNGWGGVDEAVQEIQTSIERHQQKVAEEVA